MANFNPQQSIGFDTSQRGVTNPSMVPYTPYDYGYLNRLNQSQQMGYVQNQFLKCRPVSSKQQAMASQIDLDGSLWVFTDISNGKIYTKQINNDGTACFNTYLYTQENEQSDTTEYVTKNEFNKVIQALMATMQQKPAQTENNTKQNILSNF